MSDVHDWEDKICQMSYEIWVLTDKCVETPDLIL